MSIKPILCLGVYLFLPRYVDTILQLIKVAGDYVSEEVWHRVIQIVINRDDAQGYAAKTVFEVRSVLGCVEFIAFSFVPLVPDIKIQLHSVFYMSYISRATVLLVMRRKLTRQIMR